MMTEVILEFVKCHNWMQGRKMRLHPKYQTAQHRVVFAHFGHSISVKELLDNLDNALKKQQINLEIHIQLC